MIRQNWVAAGGAKYTRNVHDFLGTTVVGTWAFEYGTFDTVWRMPDSDQPFTMRGNMLRVLQRQPDGTWKCARAIWNSREQAEPTGAD